MSIPAIEYRSHALRAYSQKLFPTHHDPYASGPRQYSSFVRIDTIPSDGKHARRYVTVFRGAYPASSSDAIDLAMQYGKDIIDGRVQAREL
jgi:hypothetical protein